MAKNKLSKFADMESFPHVWQYPRQRLQQEGFPHRGRWREAVFGNDNPIVLELGCGKGEYTVGLGARFPNKNFIGIDIKGARMWTGAKASLEAGMTNVAFLRTEIELLEAFFGEAEVDEIWITFPDPQMKKATKRLTSTRFTERYARLLRPGGVIRLKSDSPFLYTYTRELVRLNGFEVLADTSDLYAEGTVSDILDIKTYYEAQWLSRGLTIKYLSYCPTIPEGGLQEPDIEIEPDSYRSFGRNRRGLDPSED